MSRPANRIYEFGPFRLDSLKRLLLREGELVPITPKAFDVLLALVQSNGQVLEKDDLMSRLWPDTVVEEHNLTVNISALRKILGESPNKHEYIVTIPGRGYRFVANARETWDADLGSAAKERAESQLMTEKEEEIIPKPDIGQAFEQKDARIKDWKARAGSWRPTPAFIVIVVLLAGLVVAVFYLWTSRQPGSSEPGAAVRSIAVLPFNLLSQGGSDEYLGVGMADALITKLGNLKQTIVRPTSAVLQYAGPRQDPVAAGQELRVESVLEGTIQRLGDRIRVTVQLVGVGDGRQLWADKFDEKFTDIFTVQDSISERVAEALTVNLTGEEKKQLAKRYTENTEAYQLYVKGYYLTNQYSADGLKKAVEYLTRAVEIDPGYALAYVGLARAYDSQADWLLAPREVMPKAKAALERALTIDESLAEAHNELGEVKLAYDYDWPGGEREIRLALKLSPNYADAHVSYSTYLNSIGRHEEAIKEDRRAEELDPLRPPVGRTLYFARQYDRAIEQARNVLEVNPNRLGAFVWLGLASEQKEMYPEAIATLQKGNSQGVEGTDPEFAAFLAHAYAASGNRGEATKLLEELKDLSKQRYISPYFIAIIYTGLGEKDQAFEWLEKAFEDRNDWLTHLKVNPQLDSLRSDPRFQDLLRRVGLVP